MADDKQLGRLAELGLMTATLSHEIRQPLFAIRSLAQLIDAGGPERQAELMPKLLEQLDYLQRLVEGIGVYAREPGTSLGPVDPSHPLLSAAELLRHRAKRRGVRLKVKVAADIGAAIGEVTALTQVLINLTQNAIDASPNGGVVRLEGLEQDGEVLLRVSDQGEGMDEAMLERVFEPFFTTKEPGQGTGLGLGISRQLVEACGGQLTLELLSPGLRATVRLPGL